MSQVRIPSSHQCSPWGKELTIGTVGPVVKRLTNPFMWAGDEIVVDLSSTRFVRPSGLVPLATSVEIGKTLGYKVRVVCPTDAGCRSYMATSGVLRHCHCLGLSLDRSDGVEHRAATRSRKLIALRALHTDSDVASVRLDVAGVLGALLGSGGPAWIGRKAAFTGAIHEMSKNVVDYGDGASGYVLAQKYRNGYDKRSFVREGSSSSMGTGARVPPAHAHPSGSRYQWALPLTASPLLVQPDVPSTTPWRSVRSRVACEVGAVRTLRRTRVVTGSALATKL